LFTIKEFKAYCDSGGFVNYDGTGRYAFEKIESNVYATPSEIKAGKIRPYFTHVMWYNK